MHFCLVHRKMLQLFVDFCTCFIIFNQEATHTAARTTRIVKDEIGTAFQSWPYSDDELPPRSKFPNPFEKILLRGPKKGGVGTRHNILNYDLQAAIAHVYTA